MRVYLGRANAWSRKNVADWLCRERVDEHEAVIRRASGSTDQERLMSASPNLRSDAVDKRSMAAGAEAALRLIEEQGLTERGHVNLVSIEALVRHLDRRWPSAEIQVDRFVSKLLAEAMGEGGSFIRVSGTDYLICQPALGRTEAQVACLRYLRVIFKHFLGSEAKAAEGVMAVTSISVGRVEANALEPATLLALEKRQDAGRKRAEAAAQALEPFVASDGRTIRVECSLEPVIQLKRRAIIGYRLAGQTYLDATGEMMRSEDLTGLAGVDLVKRDMANAVQGLSLVRDQSRADLPAALIVPLSYSSLTSQRTRSDLLDLLADARKCAGRGLIFELSGIENAPTAALEEAISTVRPHSLFLVGKLDPGPLTLARQIRGVGLRGLAFDCPPDQDGASFLWWARATAAAAKKAAGSVLFYGASSAEAAERLALSGATHATLAAA
jgi:hypothetical protein